MNYFEDEIFVIYLYHQLPVNFSKHFLADKPLDVKVVLYNIDVTVMCSVAKCKQSCLIDHLLHS